MELSQVKAKKQWKIINTAWSTPQGKGNVLRGPFLPTTPPRSNNFWPKCNWIALRKFPALYINRWVIQAGEYTWNAPNCHWQWKGWSSDQKISVEHWGFKDIVLVNNIKHLYG